MKIFTLVLALGVGLILISCAPQPAETPEIPPANQTEPPTTNEPVNLEPSAYPEPEPDLILEPSPYPEPQMPDVTPTNPEMAYPTPDEPMDVPIDQDLGEEPEPIDYAPKPEDENWARGRVIIDSTDLLMLDSDPVQVKLHLLGALPTPCNELRAVVSPPNDEGRVDVEVYSVVDPGLMCIQVEDPLDVMIDLGEFTTGDFAVYVNKSRVGEFSLP